MRAEAMMELLRAHALGYPETFEESPWGGISIKVRKKSFASMGMSKGKARFSVKLPNSAVDALLNDWVEPTHYGMGKYGWVTATLEGTEDLAILLDWLDESFRANATKTLVKRLGDTRPAPLAPTPEPTVEGVPRILLVGEDEHRLRRAAAGLAEHGLASHAVGLDEALDAALDLEPDVIVVDVGRQASRARERADQLDQALGATVIAAGLRASRSDIARQQRAGLLVLPEPPGDPATVAATVEALRAR
jgi:predicted DNA-binding protein (MmcQ/YjbR family)/CheY-like chemotaxis protein